MTIVEPFRLAARGVGFAFLLASVACSDGGSNDIQGPDPKDPDPPDDNPPAVVVRGIPANDDLASAGLPATKQPYQQGLADAQGSADHFDFDATSHWVKTATLHGTRVDVAIENSAVLNGGPTRDAFADLMVAAFHQAWHVFGGFPYDRYAVRVRSAGEAGFSLSPVGLTITDVDYRAPSLREFALHEMFHSWNGGVIKPASDGDGNLFQWETWLVEGATVYYSFRLLGLTGSETEFRNGMAGRWQQYTQRRGTNVDQSIAGLVGLIGDAEPNDPATDAYVRMLYARGALVAYMLDDDLTDDSHNLDQVLQRLYASALNGTRWNRASLEAALHEVTSSSYAGFLSTWLDTNQALQLTGSFTLLR